ncbi:DUF3429 domain-containing protein [Pseudaestuariivita atlantica]|uniref:DUF3429 domain-containing protein n=1 Tax=Pseudaestuariivita atlantica TaxID=1317121 RepID=A0A0L1JTA1_9RHOB|nr:DUF3429 domain-containing protein [Pseudaestuariivita atlantica]KNG94648.1 hypothetical protein ATO11_04410 [Pseudaestuariivita atlantica]
MPVPRTALVLTWAGMLPFVLAAILRLAPDPAAPPGHFGLLYPTDAIAILAAYGAVILCFMSGVLWGFAAQGPSPRAPLAYVLSVIPALAVFFLATQHILGAPSNTDALFWLMLFFPGLLILDWLFRRWALAPDWWLRLRVPPTIVATISCAIGWAV